MYNNCTCSHEYQKGERKLLGGSLNVVCFEWAKSLQKLPTNNHKYICMWCMCCMYVFKLRLGKSVTKNVIAILFTHTLSVQGSTRLMKRFLLTF